MSLGLSNAKRNDYPVIAHHQPRPIDLHEGQIRPIRDLFANLSSTCPLS